MAADFNWWDRLGLTQKAQAFTIARQITQSTPCPSFSGCALVLQTITWELVLMRHNILRGRLILLSQFSKNTPDFSARLSPSDAFVFLDENPLSLDDGFFLVEESLNPNTLVLGNRPAVNHGSSTSFTFADGHAELHKWQNVYLNINSTTATASDNLWLTQHATVRR